MNTFSHNGISLVSILDTRKKSAKNLYPVKLRVTFQRKQVYYSTGVFMTEEDWQIIDNTRKKNLVDKKELILSSFENLEAKVKALTMNEDFTFEELNKQVRNKNTGLLSEVFELKIGELSKHNKVSTAEWYTYSLNSLKMFKGEAIKLSDITKDWLNEYAQFMYSKGKSRTTISMYCRALQSVINLAIEDGAIKPVNYPFGKGKFEIPEPEERKLALPLSDIKKIVEYKSDNPTIQLGRDYWFFSYLCNGANITDIVKLTPDNIKNGEICFYRAKTINRSKKPKLIQATLTPEMSAIISKYGKLVAGEYIFPILKKGINPVEERNIIKNFTKLVNEKMEIICKDLGIEKVTTYTARHSFATVLKRSGVSVSFISDQLGHSDVKTTENYLASFEDVERKKNAALLTAF